MAGLFQMVIAGVAGILALKLVGWILSGLTFAIGMVALLIKIAFVGVVAWFVFRLLRGEKREHAV